MPNDNCSATGSGLAMAGSNGMTSRRAGRRRTGSSRTVQLAGAAGFEPANGGIKSRCLTTWRRPSRRRGYSGPYCEGKGGLRREEGQLGNTPAIARKSYIHPAVIALADRQVKWRAKLKLPRATLWLSRYERALIALPESGPSAAKLIAAA